MGETMIFSKDDRDISDIKIPVNTMPAISMKIDFEPLILETLQAILIELREIRTVLKGR
jgi:hypothetical protein